MQLFVQLVIPSDSAQSRSRLVGIRMAILTLRMMESWRRLFGDADSAMIALAIVAIMSERLMRVEVPSELQSLTLPMPMEDLAKCNVSSIAAATGLNRETARRKINQLVKRGLLVRSGSAIMLAPGLTQRPEALAVVQAQLEDLRRTANDLIRMGALTGDQPREPEGRAPGTGGPDAPHRNG